MGDVNDDV
ncbi:unnamed protein product [Cuscuta europaea]|uniref:Uncharacterized protein n=1 Tax=Cuscuta europaea TaxID=41803 RepID=A0A9P0Z8R8_CUSEU|nr:unnamed protein product [Cuscuta europaea]